MWRIAIDAYKNWDLEDWKNFCRLLKESVALNKEELFDEYIWFHCKTNLSSYPNLPISYIFIIEIGNIEDEKRNEVLCE